MNRNSPFHARPEICGHDSPHCGGRMSVRRREGRMADVTFTELRSPRLLLRRLRREDGPALCAYRGLPEVARYQSWESFGPDDAARLIDDQSGRQPNVPGSWFQLAVTAATSGVLIGDCGLHC